MKSNNNNNDDDDNNNNNNTAMGSVRARGDRFLTFGLKALTETNTSRLATGCRCKLGDDSEESLEEMVCGEMDWTHPTQDKDSDAFCEDDN
jgi:hypothetical protein